MALELQMKDAVDKVGKGDDTITNGQAMKVPMIVRTKIPAKGELTADRLGIEAKKR